jgi:hypothetical protein
MNNGHALQLAKLKKIISTKKNNGVDKQSDNKNNKSAQKPQGGQTSYLTSCGK